MHASGEVSIEVLLPPHVPPECYGHGFNQFLFTVPTFALGQQMLIITPRKVGVQIFLPSHAPPKGHGHGGEGARAHQFPGGVLYGAPL